MKIPNPDNPMLVQKNHGARDVYSNIIGSFNTDIARRMGKFTPSPRLKQVFNESDDAGLSKANAFAFFQSSYWAVGDYVWDSGASNPTTGWGRDGKTDTPSLSTVYADMVVFRDQLLVSTASDVAMTTTGAWDTDWYTAVCGGSGMQSFTPHPMAVVQIGSPVLCIGDGNMLNTVVGTTATDPRLTLDPSQRIRWIVAGTSRTYIGCINKDEDIGDSYVYEWDGGDTVPTRAYKLNAKSAQSGVMFGDTLYIVDSSGYLQVLDGAGFHIVGEFPIAKSRWQPRGYDGISLSTGFVSHKGMCVSKGKILININGGADNGTTTDDEVPEYTASGIWEFDPTADSLSHKYSVTMDKTGVLDYGQRFVPNNTDEAPGAIFEARHESASLLVSGGYFTDTSTAKSAVYIDDIGGNLTRRARIITPQVFSSHLSNKWEIKMKYGLMSNANDRIVVKYRTNESGSLPFTADITWTDATTFTTTDTDFANVAVGDEVEVVQGTGGGCTAHVTAISLVTSTYTVTLSESILGVAGTETSKVRLHNWKYLDKIYDNVTGYYDAKITAPSSAWCQCAVELWGAGGDSPILEEIDIVPVKSK